MKRLIRILAAAFFLDLLADEDWPPKRRKR